jgi:hypothetical protein
LLAAAGPGDLVIVPSSAIDTMNLGGMSGLVLIAQNNLPKETTKQSPGTIST